MKIQNILACGLLLVCALAQAAAPLPLVFNGDTVEWNTEYERVYVGDLKKAAGLVEISGIACSRVTPGYIWMESDDYSDCIIATNDKGTARVKLVNLTPRVGRSDWEDMCGGVYNGKNYLFIGAFGDNNASTGKYKIVYLEEPAIGDVKSQTIAPSVINFQYPGGIKHNAESMMYDNVEQKLYIVTKVYYDVCQVFSLDMSLDYGDELQTLEYVCDLGKSDDIGKGMFIEEKANGQKDTTILAYKGFHLATAADISPDGSQILIKNQNNTAQDHGQEYSWVLLWKLEQNESIGDALKRQPQAIHSYEQEWQGEAICWLDNNVFFTVSDDDGEPPLYKYVKPYPEAIENVSNDIAVSKIMRDGQMYILRGEKVYTIAGTEIR